MTGFQKYFVILSLLLLVVIFVVGAVFVVWMSTDSKIKSKELTIQTEAHVDSLYSTYQANIQSCEASAREAKKDDKFIRENCVRPINDSPIADWLKDWGYENLLVKE